jgi:hypothetical protein
MYRVTVAPATPLCVQAKLDCLTTFQLPRAPKAHWSCIIVDLMLK